MGLCILWGIMCWGFVHDVRALYSVCEFCIMCWGFVYSVRALYIVWELCIKRGVVYFGRGVCCVGALYSSCGFV